MAFKTKMRIVVEVEVPGDQSSAFDFSRYFNLKSGAEILSQTVECLKVYDLGANKKPKEVTQTMAIIRGIVKEALGPSIKTRIKTQQDREGFYFEADLFVSDDPGKYTVSEFVVQIPSNIITVFGAAKRTNITLADPDLINKMYKEFQKMMHQSLEHAMRCSPYAINAIQKALQCKGPGVTI